MASVISATARSKTSRLCAAGARKPETLRTYCRAAARMSSSVASSGRTGGRRVLMLRHMSSSVPRTTDIGRPPAATGPLECGDRPCPLTEDPL